MDQIKVYKTIKSHKELLVLQKSMILVQKIYDLSTCFPKEELYGLTSQIRRACVAIPTNITEGYQRNHKKEYIQFLYIAKSSACELDTLLDIASNLNLTDNTLLVSAQDLLTEIIKMLHSLISKLQQHQRIYKPLSRPLTLDPKP